MGVREGLAFFSSRHATKGWPLTWCRHREPIPGADTVNRPLEYHRPGTLSAACRLLRGFGEAGLPLAGGTDVLVDLRRGTKTPRHLVSLAAIEELRGITVSEGRLRIGALVTPVALENSEVVASERPELMDAVGVFGTPQVRNRATVGGNLCTAASCGDMAPLLMALCATVVLAGPEGRREFSLEKFFSHHRKTGLRPGEILVEVVLPLRGPDQGAAYRAFGRRAANFITVAGVAAFVELQEGACAKARIALGAVFPTPLLVPEAEVGRCNGPGSGPGRPGGGGPHLRYPRLR